MHLTEVSDVDDMSFPHMVYFCHQYVRINMWFCVQGSEITPQLVRLPHIKNAVGMSKLPSSWEGGQGKLKGGCGELSMRSRY